MPDFSAVTEVSSYPVTREQIQRIYTRYRFALDFWIGMFLRLLVVQDKDWVI